ncbi:MAG: hypothetical protein NTV00_02480 [Methylococcales bacterium]|nr:hypothetical protein [Methylococcales bacterium]
MIELDSVVVILMIEALVALFLLVMGLYLWSRKKKSGDFQVAHALINQLGETHTLRTERLENLIVESCELEAGDLQALLKNIDVREKALYQQIIQVFLNRDPKVLKELDAYIQDLSKPYCAMLKKVGGNNAPNAAATATAAAAAEADLAIAQEKIARLMDKNSAITQQLQLALRTVDEVSDEYTQMFNGTKGEIELRASYRRFMRIFQSIENDANEQLSSYE